MGDEKKFTSVSIPVPLFKKVEERIQGFTSVSSYVTYVLREIIAEEERQDDDDSQPFSKEDEERVKDRLRALGYID